MAPMTLFRHIWRTNGCQIQNQRTKLPPGAQKPENWHMTSSKVVGLWWPRLTSERSKCQCIPWMSPPNTYPCPYHQQTYQCSQVSGVETVPTERKFRLTWPRKSGHRSKVIVGTDLKFSGKVWNCFMVRYNKFRDDRPIRSRVILGKPEGVASHGQGLRYKLCLLRALVSPILSFKKFGLNLF